MRIAAGVGSTALALVLTCAAPTGAQTLLAQPYTLAAAPAGEPERLDARSASDPGAIEDEDEAGNTADDEASDEDLAKDNTAEDDTKDFSKDAEPEDDDSVEDDTAGQPGADDQGTDKAGTDKDDSDRSRGRRTDRENASDRQASWQRATLAKAATNPIRVGGRATFAKREDNGDGSASLKLGARLPAPVEARVGVNVEVIEKSSLQLPPLTPERDRFTGTAWTDLAVPAAPVGLNDTMVRARAATAADENKFAASVEHKLGDDLKLALGRTYTASTESAGHSAPMPSESGAADSAWSTRDTLRLDLIATDTSFAVSSSTASGNRLHALSAEQKIAGPLSITGTVRETDTGTTDKSLKAKLSAQW
jgi:hypothetical protein